MHMLAGIVMIDVFVPICALFLQISWAFFVAFTVATIVMASKEIIYDKLMNKGACSWKDFVAGELATTFQIIVFIISYMIMT